MNLLFCIKAMDNPGGGTERVLADVAAGLHDRGHHVTVLTFDRPGGQSYYELAGGVHRIALGIGDTLSRAKFVETLKRMRGLRACVNELQPDVVVGFMHSMFLPLGLAMVGQSSPLVASEHIVPVHYRERPVEALLLMLTPLMARSITVVSEQVRQAYPIWLRRRMRVIHNPVSVRSGGVRADVVAESSTRRTLLTVGRLVAQKDHATLIDAFARVAKDFPDWDLKIVGEGELRPQLEAQVAQYRLEERVTLAGSRSDIAAEYMSAQIFALPSRYESLGLAAAEAIGHGLPVVAFSDCAGVNELVRPHLNGVLADPGTDRVGSFAYELCRLMGDVSIRAKLAPGPAGLPKELSIECVLDQWEDVLQEAAS